MGPCRSDLRPPGGRLPAHPSPAALTCPAEVARRRQGVPLQGLGHLLPRSVRDSEPLAVSGTVGRCKGFAGGYSSGYDGQLELVFSFATEVTFKSKHHSALKMHLDC